MSDLINWLVEQAANSMRNSEDGWTFTDIAKALGRYEIASGALEQLGFSHDEITRKIADYWRELGASDYADQILRDAGLD